MAREYYLYPGGLFANKEPYLVTTVLGSCVSVCLWDSVLKAGGINHYMLPLWNGDGLASPRYGNIAIPRLIEKMLDLGSLKKNLEAKVFGGGEVLRIKEGVLNVGERNIMQALDMLKQNNIAVSITNVGGQYGRKLIYDTSTGKVLMKKLKRI
jgi:chemotaxis protein CheD